MNMLKLLLLILLPLNLSTGHKQLLFNQIIITWNWAAPATCPHDDATHAYTCPWGKQYEVRYR